MVRAWIAVAALVLTTSPAVAQTAFFPPTFDPPLAAAAPVATPIDMALRPGAVTECASRERVEGFEGDEAPRAAQSRARISVEAAADGVRLRIVEPRFDLFDYTLTIDPAGGVAVENALVLGDAAPGVDALAAEIALIAPEVRLHGRALAAGDAVYDAESLAAALARLYAAVDSAISTPTITGAAVVLGETSADGRRALVVEHNMTIAAPVQGVTIGVVGYEAFDVDTGLRLYADVVIDVLTAPQGRNAVSFTIRQEVVCVLAPIGG